MKDSGGAKRAGDFKFFKLCFRGRLPRHSIFPPGSDPWRFHWKALCEKMTRMAAEGSLVGEEVFGARSWFPDCGSVRFQCGGKLLVRTRGELP